MQLQAQNLKVAILRVSQAWLESGSPNAESAVVDFLGILAFLNVAEVCNTILRRYCHTVFLESLNLRQVFPRMHCFAASDIAWMPRQCTVPGLCG